MSGLGLLLVVGAGLGYALLDLLRKLLADRLAAVPLLLWMTAGAVPIYGAWAIVDGTWPTPGYFLPGLGSAALNVVANLCFLRALQLGGLSTTVPLLSLSPALAALLSIPILGELPSPRQWAGIGLVVVGALALGFWARESSRGTSPEVARGMVLMSVVALTWSLALPLDKLALGAASAGFHGLILHAGVALAMLIVLAGRGELSHMGRARGSAGLVAMSVVCGAIALAVQLLALERVLAGLVETAKRGIGSGAALILGAMVFGEPLGLRKLVAVAIMALGVGLVLL